MAKYNKSKLFSLIHQRDAAKGAYIQVLEEINRLGADISACEAKIYAKETGLPRGQVLTRVVRQGEKTESSFLDIPVEKMLQKFPGHGLAKKIDVAMIENFVFLHQQKKIYHKRETELKKSADSLVAIINNISQFLSEKGEVLPEGLK